MNQSNPMHLEKIATSETGLSEQSGSTRQVIRNAKWGAALLAIAGMAFFIFAIRVLTFTDWQDYILVGFPLVLAGTSLLGIYFIQRDRLTLGSGIVFALNLLLPIILTIFVDASLWIAFAYASVSSALLIWRALPRRSWRWSIPSTALTLVVIVVINLVDAPSRFRNPPQLTNFITILIAVLFLAFVVQAIRQARPAIAASLQLQFVVWTGAIIAVLSTIIITFSVLSSRQTAISDAQDIALSASEAHANEAANQLAPALNAARTLASTLKTVKDPTNPIPLSREQVNIILKQVAEENPGFLGTWTTWEPNAFDGLDAEYANTPLHDETGRFIPYWVRNSTGEVEGVAVVDYETPGLNDWYNIPRVSKEEAILPPYFYPIDGVDVLLTSMAVPIVIDGQFYGVAGADYKIDILQSIVDDVDQYNGTAVGVLLTEDGTLIAVGNQPDLALQPASEVFTDFDQLQQQIANGEAFFSVSPDGQYLRAFAPIKAGKSGSDHWSFGFIIPFSEITAPATALATQQIVVSIILTTLSLMALWYLTGQFTRPLRNLTGVANLISKGDLTAVADIETDNELGTLATTFNAMTSQLREILQGLERRVEERTSNLRLAGQVGQTISRVSDLDSMLTQAAQLILEQFDLYYVQVYLTDARQSILKLQAGTGDVGIQLLERNHTLSLSTASINGRAALEKYSIVIPDTSKSSTFQKNPLLPETRGEMAVPLIVEDHVVGVLDMQSNQPNVLTDENLPAFEALAGQLAVAIQNANLLEEAKQARVEVETQIRRQIRTNWDEHLDAIHKPEQIGFMFGQNKVVPLSEIDETELPDSEHAISVPIAITGEALGSLIIEFDDNNKNSRKQTTELVNIVSRQIAQQLENLRLLENAERYRYEAEQATRRETREGWEEYTRSRAGGHLGYTYDSTKVILQDTVEDTQSKFSLPLNAGTQEVGRLAVEGITEDDQESLELVNAVAERLGAHIENLRLAEQTRQSLAETAEQTERLGHLNDFSEALSHTETLDDIYKVSANMLPNIIDAKRFSLTRPVEGGEMLEVFTLQGESGAIPTGTKLPIAGTAIGTCFTERRGIIDPDLSENTYKESALLAKQGLKSTLSVPLVVAGEAIGTVNFANTRVRAYSTRDQDLATQAASLMASTIENRQQYQRAQKQADREAMLNTISQKIQSATTVEAVLQIAARELGHALGAPMTVAQLSIKDQDQE